MMFTSDEFTAYSGTALDPDTHTLVNDLAAGIIEAEVGRTWNADPDPITKVRRVDPAGRVLLPRPVASVDEVRTLDLDGTPSVTALAGWQFDGIDTVYLVPNRLVLNYPAALEEDSRSDTVEVTWTPAAADVPAAVRAVALALAARMIQNPAGASSVSIDDYSQGFSAGSADLLPSERARLARFKRRGIASQGVTTP